MTWNAPPPLASPRAETKEGSYAIVFLTNEATPNTQSPVRHRRRQTESTDGISVRRKPSGDYSESAPEPRQRVPQLDHKRPDVNS